MSTTATVEPRRTKSVGLPESFRRRVLVVEDNQLVAREMAQWLAAEQDLQVEIAGDGQEALDKLAKDTYSLVITDLRMPKLDGMELIQEIQQRRLSGTVIVTTGHGSIDEAVQAIRMGAYDFLTKPIDLDHLRLVVERALRERMLQDEVALLRQQIQKQHVFQNILSKNKHMHAIFELINNLSENTSTVLIEGETGTGKEQIARAIHQTAHGRSGPLVAVSCAALPETLLDSELFGHEKGAFTNAVGQRRGRFELAEGGTLFLDEVGDVPLTMQAKLLRVLQERCFERVGGTETISVNVRVIAATNRTLQKMVKQGKFREDLFYRLNVVKIDLPALRDRPEDIPLLAVHFVAKYTKPGEAKHLAPEAMDLLLKYRWPGNIRELENAIERACITTRDDTIQVENLPAELTAPPPANLPFHVDLDRPLREVLREATTAIERQYISKALKKSHGHIGRCAKTCGMSRRSMTSKIAEYHIDKLAFKEG